MPRRATTTEIVALVCIVIAMSGCAAASPRPAAIATVAPGTWAIASAIAASPSPVPSTSTPSPAPTTVTVAPTTTRPTSTVSASGSAVTRAASPSIGRGTATVGRSIAAPAASSPMLMGGPVVVQNDPARTVQEFLSSLQYDPSGASSVRFLSQNLASSVKAGRPVPGLLGTQNLYHSFDVSESASGAATTATITATLNFGSGSAKRIFTLARDQNVWKITGINDPGRPS